MGSIWSKRVSILLTAAGLGLFPMSAVAEPLVKNYSLNGATGDYAPAVVHKNYALNGATGDFAPQIHRAQPSVRVVAGPSDRGFAWGDAAIGAAVALFVLGAIGTTTRRVRRRRIGAPNPARPSVA